MMEYKKTDLLLILLTSFAAISVLAWMDSKLPNHYVIASFGATSVLIFAAPQSPFSRPKNVFLGHLFSAVIGLSAVAVFQYFGCFESLKWLAAGIATSVAIVVMVLTDTTHPPGGATALLFVLSGFNDVVDLFLPVLFGLAVLMIFAYVCNRTIQHLDQSKKDDKEP